MAEKTPPKRRSAVAVKQEMQSTLADVQKDVAERREAATTPEQRIEERNVSKAVEAADALFAEGVLKGITDLRSTLGKILGQIYEIQKSASTLAALIESQQRRRDEFEADMAAQKQALTREIESTRQQWESETSDRDAEMKEADAAETKRREREKEEYRYAFAREQQLAKDQFADEKSKAERELAEKRTQSEKELGERERAVATREDELATLRQRVGDFPAEIQSAVARAVKEAIDKAGIDASAREELLKREFAGEKNVLTTRITSLEQAVKEQSAQLSKLSQQAEKAYSQVQDIAVKAIEGSSSFKSLTNLQQLLADQGRKASSDK